MEDQKQTIQLSDHVKNKIKYHSSILASPLSDELILSDSIDDDKGKFIIFITYI